MRALVLALVLLPAVGYADDPKFEYRDPSKPLKPDAPPPSGWEYKASVQLGMTLVRGNAESLGFSGSGIAAAKYYHNALEFLAQGAYAKAGYSTLGTGGALDASKEAAKNWMLKLRYDRFLTDRDSLFASFAASGDPLAGYLWRLEPQAGYARIFVKNSYLLFRGEIGYDYTRDHYIAGVMPRDADYHSARFFLGLEYKLSPWASVIEGLELLWALNDLKHVRLNNITAISATITKRVSLKVGLIMKANFDPPTRPLPVGTTEKFQQLDTILDAALAISIF